MVRKIDAAYRAGCRRYDGAIQGFGGCPMAKDDLTDICRQRSYCPTLANKLQI
jgi:hypothetical protein